MEQYFNWCIAHPGTCTVAGVVLSIVLGLVNKDKIKMVGFTISQLIRKTLGRKVEEKVEDIVEAISDGLQSDNEVKK
jgi:hypothetical protein